MITRRVLAWAAAIGVATFAAFVFLFWWAGLFDIPETETGGKAFAAALGLVGVALTQLIGFLALLFKHSLDQRTLAIQQDAENRLRMETAMQAVSLMGTPDGEEAAPSQKGAALLALGNLGSVELALAMLELLWRERNVANEAAVQVVDFGLRDERLWVQKLASQLLLSNATQLVGPGKGIAVHWPASWDLTWHASADGNVRSNLTDATVIVLETALDRRVEIGTFAVLFRYLNLIVELDPDQTIRAHAAATLVAAEPIFDPGDIVVTATGPDLRVSDVVIRAREHPGVLKSHKARVDRIARLAAQAAQNDAV